MRKTDVIPCNGTAVAFSTITYKIKQLMVRDGLIVVLMAYETIRRSVFIVTALVTIIAV
jgi:hypothetical protein